LPEKFQLPSDAMGKTRKKHARNTWDTADGGEAKGYSKKVNEGEEEETESKEELLQNIIRQLQDSKYSDQKSRQGSI
jgi:hypothetical protein